MEETMIVIYYCYGLNFCKVVKSEVDNKVNSIKELIADGAGDDGRKMKLVGVVPFDDFASALTRMI